MKPNNIDHTVTDELEKNCAREAIHLLGTVQPHGFIIVVDLASLRILQVSSGIVRHWPGLVDAASLVGTAATDWIDAANTDFGATLASLPRSNPQIVPWHPRFSALPADADTAAQWECLGHRSSTLAILEWLPLDTQIEERQRHNTLFSDVTRIITQLRKASGLDAFCQECVRAVQQLSEFDRVMLYRFLPDECGEVVAEHTAAGYEKRFLGLRFPASDIPAQARALYLTNTLRVLADVEADADTLIPQFLPDGVALDQSHGLLRSLAPVHLRYLQNMRVCSTLTVSIIVDGKLWGLIACHHHAPKVPPHQVRDGLRQLCELIAEVATIRVTALCETEALQRQRSLDDTLNQLHQHLILSGDIPRVLETRLPELLKAFGASGLGLKIGHLEWFSGSDEQQGSAQQVLDEVSARHARSGSHIGSVLSRDNLLAAPAYPLETLPDAAGLMSAHRHGEQAQFCFLTRPELVRQVRWAGPPEKTTVLLPDGQLRLEPRHSFMEWRQSVLGYCQPWEDIEAEGLKKLLQMLIEVEQLQTNHLLHQTLQWRAHHDPLTGLFNRRAMEDEVTSRLELDEFSSALLLLDVDHFKNINDNYGHATGDAVLQQLSLRLQSVVREFDLLARLGGDEFMLLVRSPQADLSLVRALAERLHLAVSAPININGQRLTVTISLGIAIPPQHGVTVGDLLRHADLALYQAKLRGRSRSVVFDPSMASDQADSYQLERDLATAIEKNQLSLVFQPKVDLTTSRVIGFEALVRWDHPERGPVSPAVFIPIAERSNQIVPIDRWVMHAAITTQARWRMQGWPMLPVAINLSMPDILSPNLVPHLFALLDEYQMPPESIEIEITESTLMHELDRTRSVLEELNAGGIVLSMDDFGTGYSSLSYLRKLPLQCLKIDQSFTQSMLDDSNAEKLTQAILAMGLALKMLVVAEGIETVDQMHWLKSHGCQIGQGYLFSRPVRADIVHEVVARIEEQLLNAHVPPESHELAG